jgi:hypothetical protein
MTVRVECGHVKLCAAPLHRDTTIQQYVGLAWAREPVYGTVCIVTELAACATSRHWNAYTGTLQDNCAGRAWAREAVYGAVTSGHYKIKVYRGSVQTREAGYGAAYISTLRDNCTGRACKHAKLCTAPLHHD